jgi:CheY-like chemotaxis protein
MKRAAPILAALLGALLLAILATTPRSPVPASAPAEVFSAERAMADVEVIAARPHPTGSEANAQVRSYLTQQMRALGMEVTESTGVVSAQGTERLNRWSGRTDPPQTLTNLIGVLPGKDRSLPAVLLMSHHDSVWGSPGAPDDTAGVASSLEVVRAIKAQGQQQRDLIMLVTDAEELGLEGAEQFFAAHPLREQVGAVINMEARGGGGRTTLFQTSRENGAAIGLYAKAVSHPVASSLSAYVYSVLPNDTDLTPVIKGSYTAYNFAFIGRSGLYHSPKATPANLDQGSLQDMGGQVLDLTRALLAAPVMPPKAPDVVFFDALGLTTITYPAWLGWLMLAAALGAFVLAFKDGDLRAARGGAARLAGLIAGAGILLYGLNRLSTGFAKGEYYDRLAAIPQLELMAMYAASAAALPAFGGWRGGKSGVVGAGMVLLILGAIAQWLAPTAAYVIVVPLVLIAMALHVPGRIASGVVAAVIGGYMLGLGHQLMQGVGPTMPMAAALPLSVAVLALLPLWPSLGRRSAWKAAAGLLLAAVSVALWVQVDAPADTRAVYADSKV